MKSGSELEGADELGEIGDSFGALRKNVQMIGHQTVGVEEEGVPRCGREKRFTNGMCGLRGAEIGPAQVTADCYKVTAMTDIVGSGQARLFAIEGHAINTTVRVLISILKSIRKRRKAKNANLKIGHYTKSRARLT